MLCCGQRGGPFHESTHIIPELPEGRFRAGGSSDKEIIARRQGRPLSITKQLPKSSFDLISRDGLSDFPGDDIGGFGPFNRSLEESENQEPFRRLFAPVVNQADPFGFGVLLRCRRRATLIIIIFSETTFCVLWRAAS